MLNRMIGRACGWLAAVAMVLAAGVVSAEVPVGEWEANYTVGDQEITATITVTKAADGKLGGKWVSPLGESELQNAKYENNRLTFTRTIAFGDNELVLDFDGTIEGDTLKGKIIGENIEADVTAKLKGGVPAAEKASLAGVWDVRYQGQQGGERRSTVTVNADMTGKVEYANRDQAITLESATQSGDDVTYRYTVQFNDNPFQVNFVGKIAGNELVGKYVNAQGNEFADVKATRRAGFALRINAGGPAWTDAAGNEWKADQAYAEGGWGYVGGETVDRTGIPIAGTEIANVYTTERYSLEAYRITVPNGKYKVTLHFAETYEGIGGPGDRVFGYAVEGQATSGLDVKKETGESQKALVKAVEVEVTDGVLDITFTADIQNPMINAIEVVGG